MESDNAGRVGALMLSLLSQCGAKHSENGLRNRSNVDSLARAALTVERSIRQDGHGEAPYISL